MILKYVSSRGKEINLIAGKIHTTRSSDFHQYEWSMNTTELTYGTKIESFKKSALSFNAEFVLNGKHSVIDPIADNIREEFEYDVCNQQIGRVYWNEWYLPCYVVSSSTSEYGRNYLEMKVKIYAPYPFWLRERTYTIDAKESARSIGGKKYSYTYDYTYGKRNVNYITIDSLKASNFKLSAHGPFTSFSLSIGGNKYEIDYEANANEYIVIDSRNYLDFTKKCYLQHVDGSTVNVFDYRSAKNEIFKKIEPGTHNIAFSGTGEVTITIYEERSEPLWT